MRVWPWLAAALLWGCGVDDAPPAVTDGRTVSHQQACDRYAAALRRKCGPTVQFDCEAYMEQDGQACTGPQRETDVARCERALDNARSCDEALDTTCGTTCPSLPWVPWL